INCDLFHFPHFNVPFLYRRPFVVTIHDLLWHEKIGFQATTLSPLKYLAKYFGYRAIINHAARHAKHILAPSQHVKSNLQTTFNLDPAQITVTYEAATDTFFQPAKNSAQT